MNLQLIISTEGSATHGHEVRMIREGADVPDGFTAVEAVQGWMGEPVFSIPKPPDPGEMAIPARRQTAGDPDQRGDAAGR